MSLELLDFTGTTNSALTGSSAPFGQTMGAHDLISSLGNTSNAAGISQSSRQNLVFIDAAINDPAILMHHFDNAQVIWLGANSDGIEQITNVLGQQQNQQQAIASVQIISHGSQGDLLLGNSHLNADTVIRYRDSLLQWKQSLTGDADLLLYGCNVAADADGLTFIQQLSQITGADVAASNNLTGTAALGGDWTLEAQIGSIETTVESIESYQSILPIYNGKEYILTSKAQSWEQAQAEAQNRGGNLVTINDAAEETWLKKTFGTTTAKWIGLSDRITEGNFQWVNGETTPYQNWAPGEPNDYTSGGTVPGGEDYVIMSWGRNKQWNDSANSATGIYRGIIEIGTATPPTPTNAGTIGIESSTYQIDETTSTATVTVVRNQGSDGIVTVDYRTVDATATAGSDYTAVSGQLTFAQGETQKSISIPIYNDTLVEGNESFNLTIDSVRGGATLLAPRTTTITIQDDESVAAPLVSFNDFSDVNGLTFNGNANQSANRLQLTPDLMDQGGTVFLNKPLAVDANTSFSTQFQFLLGGAQGSNGADGFVFMLQNSANGSKSMGGTGGDFGYKGLLKSLAIEFDTYKNRWDAGNNQISVLRDGIVDKSLAVVNAAFDLNSGSALTAWVDYNGATNKLQVFLSNTTTKPGAAALSYTIDLATVVGSQAFVGFGAGTGSLINSHNILNWSLSSNSGLLEPPTPPPAIQKQTTVANLSQPTAIDWTADGSKMFIAEKGGVIKVFENGQLRTTPFIDLSLAVNNASDRGLLDIAVHPDFLNGKPYIYALYTYDPPETAANTGLAGMDGVGNRAGRLTRITADAATNYTRAIANSEVILLGKNSTWNNFNAFVNSTKNFTEKPAGILPDGTNLQDFLAADSESHSIGSVEFGPDGTLYVSNGDGTSYNQMDPRTVRVQDINNLSGKILRIDPITGEGIASNPFFNGDPNANRSKVYQYGLRNPFRFNVHPQTGQVYVGDVGWSKWEEINAGAAGANFGWPYYEGGNGTSLKTSSYQNLAAAQTFYASGQPVTPSIFALNHAADGIDAIMMGDVYTGTALPSRYSGDLFFNDLGQGIVRNANLDASGKVTSVETFATDAQYVVQIAQGPDGNLYYVDLDDGLVGRWQMS
jgi:glucose/arabinose dehydrogenase